MRFKSMQDDLVHLRDVAGAYGEDDVAMMRAHHHHLGRGVHVFDATDPVLGRFMLKLERLVHDGGRSHVGEILLLLARGEDAGNDDVIGLGKRLREFRAEETRAGEQVRLEDHTDLGLRVAATGRIQQRSDFGRMMRVIIDDRHLADGATDLEAACGTEERGDRRGGPRRRSDRDDRDYDRDDRRGGRSDDRRGGRRGGYDRNPRYATDENYDEYRADRVERSERPRRRVRRDFDPFEN